MKRKLNIIINKTKSFILNNRLFLIYIIIFLLVGLLLRFNTIGTPLYFRALISDFVVCTFIGSFAYFMKPKNRFIYYLVWIIFISLLSIANTVYYGFYQSFLSVNLLATATYLGQVNDSLFDKLSIGQFIYLIFPIMFVLLYKYYLGNKYIENVNTNNSKKTFFKILGVVAGFIIYLSVTITSSDASRFVKLWNRESVVQKYGICVYTINDLIQSVQPKLNTLFGYDEAAYKFREYYACRKVDKKTNKYTNIFKGKNVIFIHAESIQTFLIDLKINGKEVTPNLNRLSKEGIYFNRFYPQISVGTSSDTEFTLTTGLMPSSSGTVFVNYYDRTYYGMPQYFSDMGYYTFSAHANNADYWNRKVMHQALGYKDFYAKDSYIVPQSTDDMDYVGLGLSDKSFFHQLIPIMKNIKEKNSPYFGTIITLSNHSPFNDLEKYGEFDVTMNYTYIDEDGNLVESTADYLENTQMGNYLKSAHYADEALGELFDELGREGLYENTIFIIYGDHESRLSKSQFNRLYNYDPVTDSTIEEEENGYTNVYGYYYDLLKNTPLIIWSGEKKYKKTISSTMGMYDVLPTIANMFGFEEKWSLGNDVFSNNEKIVVFPNGNVLTDKVYYSDLNDEYITFTDEAIDAEYISGLKEYASKLLDISNGIVVHDLIKREKDKIGECNNE